MANLNIGSLFGVMCTQSSMSVNVLFAIKIAFFEKKQTNDCDFLTDRTDFLHT